MDCLNHSHHNSATLLNWCDDGSDVDIKDFFSHHYEYTEWMPEMVTKFLNCLTPQNALITVTLTKFESLGDLKVEPIYGTKFTSEKFSDAQIEAWSNAKKADSENFGYSPPNPYIPEWPLIPHKRDRPDDEPQAPPRRLSGKGDF